MIGAAHIDLVNCVGVGVEAADYTRIRTSAAVTKRCHLVIWVRTIQGIPTSRGLGSLHSEFDLCGTRREQSAVFDWNCFLDIVDYREKGLIGVAEVGSSYDRGVFV